ncbi:DUF3618 domain-containing protein [Thiohalomonas denitrificans]|uniref:DUF3618 domain-containing protein n=1 Tax=Thiohalomonas denitrificans TaxID=415747 RepID=A0A1G5QZJ9_9GAMM|nr:DUF3618 domain-containing protein [Thiohalomonas denitrificans]SCZ66641.1 Protein of unknown function [Thiohalomonas denitrificans]
MSERTAYERHPGGNGQAGRPMTPEEIERDLEDTRQEMNATLEELTRRFTPESIMHVIADYVQKSGTKEFAGNLSEDIRRNPLPVALTGIGIGWLAMNSRKPPESPEEREARIARAAEKREAKAARAAEKREKVQARAEETRQRMAEKAGQTRERAEALREQGRLWMTRASRSGSDLRDQTGRMFQEQPLVLGAIGVALGALFGAAMPRAKASPKAQETGERLSEKVSETAGSRASSAAQQAEEKIRQAGQAASSSIEESERRAKEQTREHEEKKGPGGPLPH